MRAWWCMNDTVRYEEVAKRSEVAYSKDQEDNILRLYELLDEEDPNQRLMKAEIARERSMFDEALSLLEYKFPQGLDKVVNFIRDLCKAHSAVVAEIKYSF